jgi:glycosyltransferase involved in cell wall biosynthesis
LVSVIIPVRNGSSTLACCLEAVLASECLEFEVIVVDDCSEDASAGVAQRFPGVKLIRLKDHMGAAAARNEGARAASGDVLFFTDADCVLRKDTLSYAEEAIRREGIDTAVGGTYARVPFDDESFFSRFQAVFINYSELKNADDPDYIASHALAIRADTFRETGGFPDKKNFFLPMIEDVELSHRLRRAGKKLVMARGVLVSHIFNYGLRRSLMNAFRKSMNWTAYSLKNKDVLSDSGTAGTELKLNTISWFFAALAIAARAALGNALLLVPAVAVFALNVFANRRLLAAFRIKGNFLPFSIFAPLYYLFLYPVPVGVGAAAGILKYAARKGRV